ncbi:MAG: EAL domain-containing protein [Bacillus sp. (in: firmicutes)]
MYLPDIVSVIYFVACAIYFFYGLLVLSNNTKSTMHWLFFCCCLDMSIWALSFSIGNVAVDYESALFWRRIASIGWSSLYSYFLHYILLLTGNKLLKKKSIYILLYMPALLNIFLYGIYTNTVVQSYHLVQTYFGWINISGNTLLDWYFNLYYVGYSVIGIVLLFRWGFISKETAKRKQSIIIGISYIAAVIFGTLTEYIINYFLHVKVPQLASIIILIPLSAMLYCIRRYNFMRKELQHEEPKANQILSEYTKSKLYSYLSMTYVIGGFVNFGMQFFSKREQIGDILLFSSVLFGLGLAINIIQNLKIKPEYKQLFSNIAFIVSIPVIVLKYTDVSGVYAWVVPVILMLVAIALNQLYMLYFIWVVTYATLIWLWTKVPVLNMTFSSVDHLSRITILTIILWFVFYINRTYIDIINVNKEKIRLEKLLNKISNLFLITNETNVDQIMYEGIRLCGEHFNLDCVHVLFVSKEREPDSYKWYASRAAISERQCTLEKLQDMIYADKLVPEGCLFKADSKTSAENEPIAKLLETMGIKSLVIKPMRGKNETIGILCLGSTERILTWEEEEQQTGNLIVHLITDIWAKLESERELSYLANYDALTGLPNRVSFFKQLFHEINKAEKNDKLVGVIFIDIDEFKSVNDSFGHDSGDFILTLIGKTLRDCLRPTDYLARYGGDEFLILIPQMDTVDDIRRHTEHITGSFKKSFVVKNQEFYLSGSTGISVYPNDGNDPETLIKNADLAMYKSKEQGKNQYMFCTEEMKAETARKLKLIEDLHQALERQELRLYYQPQVCAKSKKIIGYEALLRWFHPELGIISPGLFIPLAEQIGLIGRIGDWVLMEACLQCKKHHLKGVSDIRVAVNVSIFQLQNPAFFNRIRQILEETQLEPHYLELEITESATVNEHYNIIELIGSLKKLGVSVSIDDFGTEYSSLSRLCDMPVDRIKLDIQFIRGIGQKEKNNAIICGIIGLAHTLGLKIIAEGVETEIQLDFLIENSIDEIQGFYFYRPVPPDELEQIILSSYNDLNRKNFVNKNSSHSG